MCSSSIHIVNIFALAWLSVADAYPHVKEHAQVPPPEAGTAPRLKIVVPRTHSTHKASRDQQTLNQDIGSKINSCLYRFLVLSYHACAQNPIGQPGTPTCERHHEARYWILSSPFQCGVLLNAQVQTAKPRCQR